MIMAEGFHSMHCQLTSVQALYTNNLQPVRGWHIEGRPIVAFPLGKNYASYPFRCDVQFDAAVTRRA